MKKIIVAMTVLLSTSAFADRMVIQNPQDMKALTEMKSLTLKKSFTFNNNKYVVVEGMDAKSLKSVVKAEKVFRDMEIYLPKNDTQEVTAATGWHVDSLQYDKLPTPTRGSSVIVAVLDTGVDYNHNNLKPRMWTNKNEIPGNQIDDDGNGYVDDVHGYDFADKDADPMDGGSHGTHCAGIVAATKHATSNARGVAPHVKLMAVRLIGSQGKSFMTDAVEAIKYSVNNGAKILTNSWRLYSSWTRYWDQDASNMLKEAIAWAGEKDVIFVAAAGNERKNNDDRIDTVETEKIVPAGYTGLSHLFVVASSTTNEGVSGFTNYGVKSVAVAAPGSNIYSTIPNNRWRNMSGTSMATPLVAGALARGLSAGMSGSEAMANMKATVNKSDLWDAKVETGHINLVKYLK
ncbi:MAG: hypothetical protein CME70_12115 [Halobacteriovorax sp.]|nr:hypothetical protein [Halobacteriovorax sp.]|tara:strand:+ start:294663 stop:295874 length:1212 start_codon:yes stop_codon:yes gene_type:complete